MSGTENFGMLKSYVLQHYRPNDFNAIIENEKITAVLRSPCAPDLEGSRDAVSTIFVSPM